MVDQKDLPLPEKELPPPHDMLLNPERKSEEQLRAPTFWEKYGSKKWLLPLLIFLGILILAVSAYGVMNSRGSNEDKKETRKERREARKEKKENKKNNKENKGKKNKKAVAIAESDWTKFSYSNGNYLINLSYPGDLKVNITNGVSKTDAKTQTTIVAFTGTNQNIQMTFEPNPNGLTLSAWHDQLKKTNTLYNSATEPMTVAGQQSLLQHTVSGTANWHAFVPAGKDKVLWINMNYSGKKGDAKEIFIELLNSLTLTPR